MLGAEVPLRFKVALYTSEEGVAVCVPSPAGLLVSWFVA